MSLNKLFFSILLLSGFIACQKDDVTSPDPVTSGNSTMPIGAFSVTRSGVFQKQNGYNAEGTAQIGTDNAGLQWLRLASDFNASLSTGAVTVYLSQNQNLMLNTPGSFRRVSLVTKPGEHFYKLDPAAGADLKFVILWCASAGVQFGNAQIM